MVEIKPGSFHFSLALLMKKGVNVSTVVDLGCAQGSFFVSLFASGLIPNCVPLNIDANPIYEPVLRDVKDALGGEYFGAMSDAPGEMMLTKAIHPYWSSLRPTGDPYWDRVNKMNVGVEAVRVFKLDDVVAELEVKPPFLLKLDIQGGEARALRGAKRTLAETNVVICEADIDDFREIDAELSAAGFDLFDLTSLNFARDHSLAWFYPVYLSRRFAHLRERHIWDESANEDIIKNQNERADVIRKWYADVLPKMKVAREKR